MAKLYCDPPAPEFKPGDKVWFQFSDGGEIYDGVVGDAHKPGVCVVYRGSNYTITTGLVRKATEPSKGKPPFSIGERVETVRSDGQWAVRGVVTKVRVADAACEVSDGAYTFLIGWNGLRKVIENKVIRVGETTLSSLQANLVRYAVGVVARDMANGRHDPVAMANSGHFDEHVVKELRDAEGSVKALLEILRGK